MDKMKCKWVFLIIPFLFGCATIGNKINNSNILIETTSQGILISSNELNVKMLVLSESLQAINERSGGGQSNPNYFYLVDTNVNGISVDLHLSGWLEPIEKYKYDVVLELWANDLYRTDFFNEHIEIVDNWAVLLYDVPVPEIYTNVYSSHMRANLLHGDTWIDLHLSITDMKSSEYLHNVLLMYMNNIQIIE